MSILTAPGRWGFNFDESEFEGIKKEAEKLCYPILKSDSAKLLHFLCLIHRPRHILELGTGLGYSTRHMAAALSTGTFYLCDYNPELLDTVASDLPLFDCYKLSGPANESLLTIPEEQKFDLIFLDIDKRDYLEVFEMSWPKLRLGGLMIVDNIFFSGRVFEDHPTKKAGVNSIHQLVELAEKWPSCLFPCDDGLLVITKPDY